jgi:hypothetical protein
MSLVCKVVPTVEVVHQDGVEAQVVMVALAVVDKMVHLVQGERMVYEGESLSLMLSSDRSK